MSEKELIKILRKNQLLEDILNRLKDLEGYSQELI